MKPTAPPGPGAAGGGRRAWVDASAGVAGDMLLAALVDAGASLDAVAAAVEAVIPGAVRIEARTVTRAGLRATKVDVTSLVENPPHRHWTGIRDAISAADLAEPVRADALAVFGRLAAAEAHVHGVEVDAVHFHEVGAWDSVADVVGVCAALADLGVADLDAGPVAVGSGTVRVAHGEMPVPVPAVLELSTGWQVHAGGVGELATPTGMALVTALARECRPLPPMVVQRAGVGAGTRDTPGRANVVRVAVGVPGRVGRDSGSGAAGGEPADAMVLETNVDDLDPRLWPTVLADLMAAGALDAWLTPVLMKKGRPAHTLTVLAAPGDADALAARVFALVPTLGVRSWPVARQVLDRTWRTVDVDGAPVRVKLGLRDGLVVSATPEFEDVAAAAAAAGTPLRETLSAAGAAADRAGLRVGAPLPD